MTPEDEDVRIMQREISNVLLAHGRRIRCGNDLATVRKVLGEVQTDVAEFLRASDAPGGEVCAEPGGTLPAEAGITATPGASMSIAARAKMLGAGRVWAEVAGFGLRSPCPARPFFREVAGSGQHQMLAADDIAQGRVVGSRGAPGFLVRGITERRRARELEQDEAKAQRRAGWIKTADRLPTAADHYLVDPLGREAPARHVPCLAVTILRPRETELLQWDLRRQCWDDRNGRPFTGNPGDVICWMPLPDPPLEVSDGE